MNAKDVGGAMVMVGCVALIGYAMYVTKSTGPLWAIVLLIWFAHEFPWSTRDQ